MRWALQPPLHLCRSPDVVGNPKRADTRKGRAIFKAQFNTSAPRGVSRSAVHERRSGGGPEERSFLGGGPTWNVSDPVYVCV